ncbi:MAG: DUF1848 family protein [Desulfatitalea sp.]
MQRIVISASRRTDIPAFYMPWFMQQIKQGFFEVHHPFGRTSIRVPAAADQVHTLVFWSKNFGPFLEGGFGQQLVQKRYHLFFNFTINSAHTILEPAVPPTEVRIAQLARLADLFGPEAIQWRFDPICYYRASSGKESDNLAQLPHIARRVAALGIRICITSFVDLYRKVQRRAAHSDVTLIDPPMDRKIEQIVAMTRLLAPLGVQLQLCCERALLAALPEEAKVVGAACIPNDRLAALYGADLSLAKDSGQRVDAGCGCRVSRDIGSYQLHPCRHNCLFCYANPQGEPKAPILARHDGESSKTKDHSKTRSKGVPR